MNIRILPATVARCIYLTLGSASAKPGGPGQVSGFYRESIVLVVLVTGEEKQARGDGNFA